MIERHASYTGSARAKQILDDWDDMLPKFVRSDAEGLQARARVASSARTSRDLSGDEAIMAAFEENARDLARVGGN